MAKLTHDTINIYLPGEVRLHTGGVYEKGPRLILDDKGIEGLDSAPSIRRESPDRPFSQGVFPEKGHYGARYVALSGYAFTETAGELHDLRDALRAALDPTERATAEIHQTYQPVRYMHYIGAELTWDQQTDTRARFSIEFYCPDPRLYGKEKYGSLFSSDLDRDGLTFKGGISFPLVFKSQITGQESSSIQNDGNATAYPVFTFRGNADSLSITDQGRTLTYAGTTSENTALVINTYTGEVRYGEADRSFLLTSRDWITIPPRSAITPTVDFVASPETEGSLSIEVSWRDTYL